MWTSEDEFRKQWEERHSTSDETLMTTENLVEFEAAKEFFNLGVDYEQKRQAEEEEVE